MSFEMFLCQNFILPHQVIPLKKRVTKGNSHFFLWGQGFVPQWHKKPIHFCAAAYLLLVIPSNPQTWDIRKATILQYHPLCIRLDCSANYVVISGILCKTVITSGWRNPRRKYYREQYITSWLSVSNVLELNKTYKNMHTININPELFYVINEKYFFFYWK